MVQISPSPSKKPDYFKVMRPFGKEGFKVVNRGFNYERFDSRKVQSFHGQRAAMDISTLGRRLLARFITLLPSASLRLFSFTSKRHYRKCLSLRGLEVQLICTNLVNRYKAWETTKVIALDNGRLIVNVYGDQTPAPLKRFFRFFRSRALLYNGKAPDYTNGEVEALIPKTYTSLYCTLPRFDEDELPDPSLFHRRLQNVEFFHSMNDDPLEWLPFIQTVNCTSFSFLMDTLLDSDTLELFKSKLVESRHPDVKNLYFGLAREKPLCYRNSYTLEVFDERSNEWRIQALPDEKLDEKSYNFQLDQPESIVIPEKHPFDD